MFLWRTRKLLWLLIFTSLALVGCEDKLSKPHRTNWLLPDKTRISFYHEPSVGWPGDHAKCLEITRHSQSTELFKFGESHSGYDEVDLYISDNKQTIWILDHRYGRVGASFDFPSQVFKGEGPAILPSDQPKILPPPT